MKPRDRFYFGLAWLGLVLFLFLGMFVSHPWSMPPTIAAHCTMTNIAVSRPLMCESRWNATILEL